MQLRAREGREGRGRFLEYILTDSQPNTASKHVTSLYCEKNSSMIIVYGNNDNNLPPSFKIGILGTGNMNSTNHGLNYCSIQAKLCQTEQIKLLKMESMVR